MSNPLPVPAAAPRRGSAPNPIEPQAYPALEQLRQHVSRDGVALIDRVYADAQALHRRVRDLEAELELYRPAPDPADEQWPNKHGRVVDAAGEAVEDLL